MVKKLKSISEKKSSPAAGLLDGQLAQSVKDSAQQIWLAGMGAFAKAQEEGGKVFESLVKEGTSLQRKTQGLAEDKISEVTGKMSAMAGTVTAKAGQNWDKLEAIFEQRTAKAMSKLGVPTAKDIDSLSQRVEELAAAVAKMGKAGGSVRATAPAKKVSKPAAKAPGQTASKSVTKAATSKAANKAANKTVAAKRTRKAAV
jgi:poly(hydroxyalkanoate) granule-associated protein